MDQFIQRPADWVTAGLVAAVIILFIRNLMLGSKLKRIGRSYSQFMSGTGIEDLEQVIIDMKERISGQEKSDEKLKGSVEAINETLRHKKGNVGILRYNAFADRGSDLSFSLAIVDDQEDGLVLSGLHSRDQTFVYAKPVKQGQSEYPLTPEEAGSTHSGCAIEIEEERILLAIAACRLCAIISDIRITRCNRVFCRTKYSINPPTFTIPVMWMSPTGGRSLFTPAPGRTGPYRLEYSRRWPFARGRRRCQ